MAKAVLKVGENGIGIKKIHDRAMDDVLEKFTTYRRKRNRAVVLGLRPVTFLEYGDYVGKAPVL